MPREQCDSVPAQACATSAPEGRTTLWQVMYTILALVVSGILVILLGLALGAKIWIDQNEAPQPATAQVVTLPAPVTPAVAKVMPAPATLTVERVAETKQARPLPQEMQPYVLARLKPFEPAPKKPSPPQEKPGDASGY